MTRWLFAFVFTQAVEIPLFYVGFADRHTPLRRLAIAFGASAITHPVVWFVFPRLGLGGLWPTVLAAEAFAIAVEGVWLRAFGMKRALAWALGVNVLSAGLGIASRVLLGVP